MSVQNLMDNGSLILPEAASTVAAEVDILFYVILWWSILLFIFMVGFGVFFVFSREFSKHVYSIVRKKNSNRIIPGKFQKWACAEARGARPFLGFFRIFWNFPDFFIQYCSCLFQKNTRGFRGSQ